MHVLIREFRNLQVQIVVGHDKIHRAECLVVQAERNALLKRRLADLRAHLHAEGLDPGEIRAAHQRAERALAAVLQGDHDIAAAALDLVARKLISRGLVSTRELRGELLNLLLLSLFVALIRRTCLLPATGCQCHCRNDRCRADRRSLPSSKQSHWFPPFPPDSGSCEQYIMFLLFTECSQNILGFSFAFRKNCFS